MGRLYRELADDYGELANAYIPTGASALESADSELESADSNVGSNADAVKVGKWVWAFKPLPINMEQDEAGRGTDIYNHICSTNY